MTEHEDAAAAAERELADLEERTEKLADEIAEAREDLVDAEGDKPDEPAADARA